MEWGGGWVVAESRLVFPLAGNNLTGPATQLWLAPCGQLKVPLPLENIHRGFRSQSPPPREPAQILSR